ncbi:hypothetical protein ColTof3_12671 [Colletotrichum tofieldiae]|nr:hypothetical protein ColTof3_12671 [Colletotrichum tofieldiae]
MNSCYAGSAPIDPSALRPGAGAVPRHDQWSPARTLEPSIEPPAPPGFPVRPGRPREKAANAPRAPCLGYQTPSFLDPNPTAFSTYNNSPDADPNEIRALRVPNPNYQLPVSLLELEQFAHRRAEDKHQAPTHPEYQLPLPGTSRGYKSPSLSLCRTQSS